MLRREVKLEPTKDAARFGGIEALVESRRRVGRETVSTTRIRSAVAVQGASVVDAMVMVSAAFRGDVVYTSDEDDLVRLRDARFPNTPVLRI